MKKRNIKEEFIIKASHTHNNKYDYSLVDYVNNKTKVNVYGKQHFQENEYFGGLVALKQLQKHDNIKNMFCKEQKIDLLRLRYDENVTDKLNIYL